MVKNYIVYGYAIIKDIMCEMFQEKYFPNLYKNGVLKNDENVLSLAYEEIQKNKPDGIFMYCTDGGEYEFSSESGLFWNTGDQTMVIGVKISEIKGKYYGLGYIPNEISEGKKNYLENFIKSSNIDLNSIKPRILTIFEDDLA